MKNNTTSGKIGGSCCNGHQGRPSHELTRRNFIQLTGMGTLGTVALSGLSWSNILSVAPGQISSTNRRKPLTVKPVLTYEVAVRKEQTSWRYWGGIQTEKDAVEEIARIQGELKSLNSRADFPVEFLPVAGIKKSSDLNSIKDIESADLLLIYAAGGDTEIFDKLNMTGKNIIFFCRHKSGPVYLYYEVLSPFYLRKYTDRLAIKGIDEDDVVIDSQDELMWRLRALCGLKNSVGSRIISIGGIGAWGHWARPDLPEMIARLVKEKFRLEILTVSFDELGTLIKEAKNDKRVVADAKKLADKYLQDTGIKLETKRQFVENCFVLKDVFEKIMVKYNCSTITVNNCMDTIMPISETSACLALSLLNDAGYLAFCESDFVVIPAGILLAHISGKPVFLNDPTYPHNNIITLAHCTSPRRLDGKKLEPARILTHYESDYGAAPKVEMPVGQVVTSIMPDFEFDRNVGLLGKIIDNPFLDICRTQIDIKYDCDSRKVAEKMPGFHWMTVYGDYMKETGYALKKIGIKFENLG